MSPVGDGKGSHPGQLLSHDGGAGFIQSQPFIFLGHIDGQKIQFGGGFAQQLNGQLQILMFDLLALGQDFLLHKLLGRLGDHLMLGGDNLDLALADHLERKLVGDGKLAAIPAELFVEVGRDIKSRSPFEHTLLITPANGYIGYVGTKRNYEEGGYEMTSAVAAPGIGETITDATVELLRELRDH